MNMNIVWNGTLTGADIGTSTIGSADTTNFPVIFPPPSNLIPSPIQPVQWEGTDWWKTVDRGFLPSANPFYEEYKKATEPDIPMAPPTNRRRIKLRD